jgi:DNA polymerase-3 subunit delta'
VDLLSVERSMDERGRMRSEIVVEDARAVADFLHLTPAEGGWRVVVIDGAEEMNRSAANAVLKILEEPPRQSLILMVSHAPGRLLATIRSRCRRLALEPLAREVVARILADQRPELAPDDASLLAGLAEGSAGRALALAEEAGLALFRETLGLLSGLPQVDVPSLHRLAGRATGSDGEAAYHIVSDILLWWLARLIRTGASDEAPMELLPGETAVYRRLAGRGSLDRWLEVWEKTRHLFSRVESLNLERKQILLNAILAVESASRP